MILSQLHIQLALNKLANENVMRYFLNALLKSRYIISTSFTQFTKRVTKFIKRVRLIRQNLFLIKYTLTSGKSLHCLQEADGILFFTPPGNKSVFDFSQGLLTVLCFSFLFLYMHFCILSFPFLQDLSSSRPARRTTLTWSKPLNVWSISFAKRCLSHWMQLIQLWPVPSRAHNWPINRLPRTRIVPVKRLWCGCPDFSCPTHLACLMSCSNQSP